jgi:hypothetical protein
MAAEPALKPPSAGQRLKTKATDKEMPERSSPIEKQKTEKKNGASAKISYSA